MIYTLFLQTDGEVKASIPSSYLSPASSKSREVCISNDTSLCASCRYHPGILLIGYIEVAYGNCCFATQDPCYNVRMMFLRKLNLLVSQSELPARFNVIFFLTVHDPEEDVRIQVRLCAIGYFS